MAADGNKIAGATVTAVKEREPQSKTLLRLADKVALWHSPEREAYADVLNGETRQTWQVRGKAFKLWLRREFYRETGGAPNAESMGAALGIIEARAVYDGAEFPVFVRVGSLADTIYLDLADSEWRAVEIDAEGWRIVSSPPVRFHRSAGMLPLPVPVAGGSIDALKAFVNIPAPENFVLLIAWLLAALRECGPYPVLVLLGQAGSAKSFLGELLRLLTDPAVAMRRSLPREEYDLFITATNGHVSVIDNISKLPDWLSDALCRLATGGGFAARTLYTNTEETVLDAMKPVVLTGIEDFVVRGDLADRALFLPLDPIHTGRKTEKELRARFKQAQPGILGALLDAVAHGIKHLPHTHVANLPRMADFALWVVACEGALWPAGTFVAAYEGNRADVNDTVIEADSVALAVRDLLQTQADWSGTATALLERLSGSAQARAKGWPAAANTLSGRLRRAAPNLRQIGISVDFITEGRDRDKQRVVKITPLSESKGNEAIPPYTSRPTAKAPLEISKVAGSGSGKIRRNARPQHRTRSDGDVSGSAPPSAIAHKKPRKTKGVDTKNDGNAISPSLSTGKTPNGADAERRLGPLDRAIVAWDRKNQNPAKSVASISKKFGQPSRVVRQLLGRAK